MAVDLIPLILENFFGPLTKCALGCDSSGAELKTRAKGGALRGEM